jgi:hypothetical protein
MARADAPLMSSSKVLFALLSDPPRIEKRLQPGADIRLSAFDSSRHNSIDLAKIGVLASTVIRKGRRAA